MTISFKSIPTIVLSSLMLAGCSHTPPPIAEPKKPIFSTQIKTDGEKVFNLHLVTENQGRLQQGRGGSHGGRDKGPPPSSSSNGGESKDQKSPGKQDRQHQQSVELEQRLQDKIYETKYCREGYELKDTYIGFSFQVITGSCIDRANTEDRSRFPNTDKTEIR